MTELGPTVVALGGGHGLAATLRATRRYAGRITGIVSVADDGGSSGRLREALGIPAPGDLRKCLVALGDEESLWGKAFGLRFEAGELEGHAFGNLVIAGLARASGDFLVALETASRLVETVGHVLPATRVPVVLHAEVEDAGSAPRVVRGEVAINRVSGIRRVTIDPITASAPYSAIDAIADADQVIIGPGSLYTSVLAVLAVPDITQAINRSSAQKIYVCNLHAQERETEGYDVADHVRAVVAHGVQPDVVVYDSTQMKLGALDGNGVEAALARPDGLAHDPQALAGVLEQLIGARKV